MNTYIMKLSTSVAVVVLMAVIVETSAAQEKADERKQQFSEEQFEALTADGAIVLIDVFADWCPTCARQQTVLAEFRAENPDAPIHFLTVDFDNQKKYVRKFKAPRQSTLILYHGDERVWFSVAETDRDAIFAALNDALASK
jgi:thioredoxin 1